MSPRYGRSPLTGTWYRVEEWEEVGEGRIVAKEKTEVDPSEVPEEVREEAEDR